MNPLLVAAAIGGGLWGLVADRIAARWPEHDDGLIRSIDWRTAVVVLAGAAAFPLLVLRHADAPAAFAYLGILIVALILLFATDLDQRLLPDVISVPISVYALLGFVTGAGPFVRTPGELLVATIVAIAVPGAFYVISIPFGAGAIGLGDLKLLFGVGLLAGIGRLMATVIVGVIIAAVVILALVAARRITLKSYVPYGPFLIIGAIWALTVSR